MFQSAVLFNHLCFFLVMVELFFKIRVGISHTEKLKCKLKCLNT